MRVRRLDHLALVGAVMQRAPLFRASFGLPGELVVDSFAGGGGASIGLERALGRPVDIAINHDPEAIAMHEANHPSTRHYCENIWKVDPIEACGGRRVGIAWFSPDCTHHSRAKGGKPVDKNIRGLAWVVITWARKVRPRIIMLENVEEWLDWCPLVNGRPDPKRKGLTFRRWCGSLRNLGYQIEFRRLIAAEYGAPTIRKRLYLIARCDGLPIRWPLPSHGRGRALPWRTAAEIIQWELPCPSIFERERPLAEKTLARIAEAVRRYVLEAAQPFIAPLTHHGANRVYSIEEPLRTITGAHRGEHALVSPTLIQTSWGEREGQAPRVPGLEKPIGTIVAGGIKHALVSAFLTKHYGGVVGHELERPIGTVTARDHHSLTTSFLTKFYGTSTGAQHSEPLPTVTGQGQHLAEVRAFLTAYYGSDGSSGSDLFSPLRTVTAKDRFGLVAVAGDLYQISDIGMRMLAARELFNGNGFPRDYLIDVGPKGKKLSKTAQVRMAGNSVVPQVADALARAQIGAESQEGAVA